MGVRFARGHLGDAGVDVAAQVDDAEVGSIVQALRLAPQAGGAEAGADGQVRQGLVVDAEKGVAGVLSLGDGGEG